MTINLEKHGIPWAGDVNAKPHATPKHQLPTKVDRLKAKKTADREDEKLLAIWSQAVKDRDQWKDRKTGKPVRRTHVLALDSAHAHHIAPRNDLAVRYDVRNGLTLSFETHERVERGQLQIVGTRFFTKNGKRYINGKYPVHFKETT